MWITRQRELPVRSPLEESELFISLLSQRVVMPPEKVCDIHLQGVEEGENSSLITEKSLMEERWLHGSWNDIKATVFSSCEIKDDVP